MAEMVWSALAQEAVSRGVSFGLSRREEKPSQGHLMERLRMAVSELEFALERSQELPIRHLSLLGRRKQIKLAYVEAMGLLDRHNKQQAVPAGKEQVAHGAKRKRWGSAKNTSFTCSFAGLSTDDVRRLEWYADCAAKFVRDVESGCSLHHNTFCNPLVRHLLEGKTLRYFHLEQGNLLRSFYVLPIYSDERGMEAVLLYRFGDTTMIEKCFTLLLFLRLSESTDIAGTAIKGLQLLTSRSKLATECAMGELALLSNLQDIAHSYGPPWVGIQEQYIIDTQLYRPDPSCCKGRRHGLCANNNVSSELSDIFPEQVIFWWFRCYYVPAVLEPSRSSCSSFDVVGRSKSRGGGKQPPLLLTAVFAPHVATETQDSCALATIGDVKEYRDASIQQVAETLKSDAISCIFRQPELTKYIIVWFSRHGGAFFMVEKASMETNQEEVQYTRKHEEKSREAGGLGCLWAVAGLQQQGVSFQPAQAYVS